ncbi:type I pantothenate kinase [Stappia sp. F7233]|uniref:Pantothenate kinase n=1 Tax=Stappia albiluteola TaxID=2758565 RepID=A0A839AJF8_9HYPH|nr:type I pantothenate kinase [Stappia albiluteola]MBA5778887.1 type I pantothenate kinase [Stappia albiluteola]
MDKTLGASAELDLSPYRTFSEAEWSRLRADTPMTLTAADVKRLQSLNDPVSLAQVESIYLPLSRLLSFYVEATLGLHAATSRFLGKNDRKNPFVIGIAGSVAVGKSTTARLLQALLARWPASPKVDLVTTDGFLHPNSVLETQGLMRRKGFPESYDRPALLKFLSDIKAGKRNVKAPVYSHFYYDVMPGQHVTVDRPDILILEGLNVLQTSNLPKDAKAVPFVSDFFDFSIYIDADEAVLHDWYMARFMRLRETAFRDPGSYFHRYSLIEDGEALRIGEDLWTHINLVNLHDNILPTRPRADLILTKGASHAIEEVALRKL